MPGELILAELEHFVAISHIAVDGIGFDTVEVVGGAVDSDGVASK